ncbi:MAG: T9SS type A sorting domain-containing protein [Bacteroidales bacterium]
MKRISVIFIFMIAALINTWAAKSYEMEVRNLVQVNETEFTFDVRMKNTNPSEPFAIEAIQWQLSFNTAMMNGGSLNNTWLTYVTGTTDLVGTAIIPASENFSTNQTVMQWVTASLGDGAQTTLFNTSNWIRIGTFRVQLRNAGNTAFHNFGDVAHSLAFVQDQVIVNTCNYTTSGGLYYRSGSGFELITSKTLTNSLSNRKLAGYCFTGSGNWSATARWNNVTTANFNTLPGATNNVIVAGSTTVSDTRTVKDVTLMQGSYMVISPAAQLTADNLYNDNTGGGGGGVVNLAEWNFQNAAKRVTGSAYSADNGISGNINSALFNVIGNQVRYAEYPSSSGNFVGRIRNILTDDYYYIYNTSTLGYVNLTLSYRQILANNGPLNVRIQTRPDALSSWVTLKDIVLTTAGWLQETDIALPVNLENKVGIQIRWVLLDDYDPGDAYIDDIVIKGTLPPTGLLIQSTSGGTGSLIHNSTGVEAKVERYITGWLGNNNTALHGWHFLSSPVASEPISVFHNINSGNDFYKWVETNPNTQKWVNRKSAGPPIFEALFAPRRGYLMANADASTPVFTGILNVTSLDTAGLTNSTATNSFHAGWHLLGNPFSSAIGFNLGTWNRVNVGGVAQIWNEANGSYTVLSGNQVIPAMNGFMVYTTGGGSLTIPADARIHSNTGWYKETASNELIKLKASDPDGQTAQEAILAFNPEASDGFDLQYDSYFMGGFAPSFYTSTNDNYYSLNTLPELRSDLVIPVGFIKNGSSNFNIQLVENIPGITVYLKDLKLNQDQDLTTFPIYNFTSSDGDNPARFQLHFATVLVNETSKAQPVNIYGVNNTIYIASKTGQILTGDVIVYNMIGQAMIEQSLSHEGLTKITVNSGTGYYLVKVVTPDQIFSGKVFIK